MVAISLRYILGISLAVFSQFALARPLSATPDDIASHYRFNNVAPETMASKGPQRAMVQDAQGFIWLAGYSGLMRYDGFDFILFTHDPRDPTSLSSSKIRALAVDDQGTLWIGTTNGLNRYNRAQQNFTHFPFPAKEPLATKLNDISALTVDDQGRIWLATFTAGLVSFDPNTEQFERYRHFKNDSGTIPSDHLLALLHEPKKGLWIATASPEIAYLDYHTRLITRFSLNNPEDALKPHNGGQGMVVDQQGKLWVATNNGIVRLDPSTGRSVRYRAEDPRTGLKSSNFFGVAIDADGLIWGATEGGGLNLYLVDSDTFINFTHDPTKQTSIPTDKIWAIYRSPNNDLWFSHFPHGVSMLDQYAKAFKNYSNDASALALSHNEVLAVIEDESGLIWVGTENGLTVLNLETGMAERFFHNPQDPNSLPARAVTTLMLDSKGVLWVGTWGGGLCHFDRQSKRCTQFQDDHIALRDISITQIIEDTTGKIWLGTNHGLFRYDRDDNKVQHYYASAEDVSSLAKDYVYTLMEDSQQNLWVGTELGLDLFDRKTGIFTHHRQQDGNPNSLGADLVRTVVEDSQGRVWVGTWGGGLSLYNPDSKDFTVYGTEDGLTNDGVISIVEDSEGNLWLSTNDGLEQFNPETKAIQHYGKEHGLAGTAFIRNASMRSQKTGHLYIGGTHGLTVFRPGNIYKNTAAPKVQLTNFYLFSQLVKVGAANSPLTQPLSETQHLTLTHHQSVFSFDFVALDFKIPTRNQFQYRLKGFEDNWQAAGYRRTATYTNIDPGDYVFEVIGSNNDGVWSTEGASIHIHILPPWWLTWWAYALYASAILGALTWLVLHQKYKRRLLEEQNQKLIAIDRMKDDFIANTSHELRTPLNGIIGLADSLIEGAAGDVNDLVQMNLKMISTSGKRLSSLVNDILDFSKLKSRGIKLNCQPTSLYDATQLVLNICAHTPQNRSVAIINSIPANTKAVMADEERLQQILYNLVGNAIKFTHSGSITVESEEKDGWMWVKVIDTGIGIPKSGLTKIFNSFEQLEDHHSRQYSGTGLGLTITKQLVELHGGVIRVESEEGKGSCFMFSLPTTDEVPMENLSDQASNTNRPVPRLTNNNEPMALASPRNKNSTRTANHTTDVIDNSQFKILIVDDNPINQQVMINQLTLQNYRFAVAEDGPSALRMIEHDGPFDLVLLDIMMPHMSGYDVCVQLRETYPMEELPIIFLTAKNTISDLVSGFELGANDFLTKPIAIGELNSRLKTHLQLLTVNRSLEKIVAARTQEVHLAHDELKTLDGMVSIINQQIRMAPLLPVLLHQTRNLFPQTDYVAFWQMNDTQNGFRLMVADTDQHKPTVTESIAVETIEPLLIQDENKIADEVYLHTYRENGSASIILPGVPASASVLCMSIAHDQHQAGILVFGSQTAHDAFDGMQPVNYKRLRTHVESALSKARLVEELEQKCEQLEQMGLTDPLTGMKNRRFLSKYIDRDISLLQRKHYRRKQSTHSTPPINEDDFIFFLVDIDHFKHTNDTYGHAAGDKVLAEMRKIIDPIFRTSDYQIRWGGEEFLIVARFCDRASAPIKAEQLRTAMANYDFEIEPGKNIRKTCSIGFACYPFANSHPNAFSWSQVINLADLALYAVKSSQRNGWLGIHESGFMDDNLFKNIMENPEHEILNQHIRISTDLTKILWP